MSRQEEFQNLIKANQQSPQTLARTPEPDQVTTDAGSVKDYASVMQSNMTANYAVSLELIARSKNRSASSAALDLCCGPGHLTFCLNQQLGYKNVKGIDLSAGMIEVASRGAESKGLTNSVSFSCQDVLHTSEELGKYDLVSLTNSAHHLPHLDSVASLLNQAERLVNPQGLIFISDLARLKSEALTQKFVQLAAADYGEYMQKDFLNSMRAAWLPSELTQAIPAASDRIWYSVVLAGIPFLQALIGLPVGRKELFVNPGINWSQIGFFPNKQALEDWQFMSLCLEQAEIRKITLNRSSAPSHEAKMSA